MKTNAQKIKDFHTTMGAIAPDKPTMPSQELLNLRLTLIREEYEEVTEQFNKLIDTESTDMASLIHELTDLLYVTYGAIWACGVDPDPIFEEVHSANMRKLDGPRRADGKVLKPQGWQPANVAKIIEEVKKA
ncbi:MAG: putative HAD superfamily Cof-like phosphohydrolase [Cellvibrionaceae bacterium]|jgi:predicted HAD superfamily Cof-like phosphohydrolase